jgi:hypothetical protein
MIAFFILFSIIFLDQPNEPGDCGDLLNTCMDSYPDDSILVPAGKKQASAGFVEMHF